VLLLDYQARCQFEISEPVRVASQETYATAEGHRRHGDFEFIDDTEVQVLLDRIRAARNPNIATTRLIP
jgi:hypothetical protein